MKAFRMINIFMTAAFLLSSFLTFLTFRKLLLQPLQPHPPLPVQVTTFHRFSYLPPEIRSQIWNLAIPSNSRFVLIRSRTRFIEPVGWAHKHTWAIVPFDGDKIHIELEIGVPALLRTCRESRERAMKVYVKAWERGEGRYEEGEKEREAYERGWRYTWVNTKIDKIIFGGM